MSASDKKKLRKEQAAAAMTERQLEEAKKLKKNKAYTLTFIIVMVLVVAIVAGSAISTPILRTVIRNTQAAQVGNHEISATELNYFFVDAISSVYNQFSGYGDYQDLYAYYSTGWNPAKPVGDQIYDSKTGETYADYFAETALENAKWTYTMYDKAMADGFKLTEDDQKAIDNNKAFMELYATMSGSNVDGYVRSIYGTSATLESYMEYYTVSYIASQYAADYLDSLEFTTDELREYETDKLELYNSYSWYSYFVDRDTYLEGGTKTKGEDGKETTTYSKEEYAAAEKAAKAAAESLLGKEINSLELFNKAIKALEKAPKDAKATEYTSQTHPYAERYTPNEDALKWLISTDRVVGDMKVFEYTTEDSKGNKTVEGYYVLYYVDTLDNKTNVATVRHLLVAFEKDKDGKVSDNAKAAAKAEAEKLLNEFKKGKQTEDDFIKLLKANSDDKDSSGKVNNEGLYENITADSSYVEAFRDWAIADHMAGETGIVETEYGYHIMYYVEKNEMNYRDLMINADMEEEAYDEWEEAILKDASVKTIELKYINKDFIMANG